MMDPNPTDTTNPETDTRAARVVQVASDLRTIDPRDVLSQLVWDGREGGWTLEEVEAYMPKITATISATPSDHIDPESPSYAGSVDAAIWRGDRNICDVTLLAREDGVPGLAAWGEPSHWCSSVSELGEDIPSMAAVIISAVEAALKEPRE